MVTSITKDTYPAVILLIALLGVYHTSTSLIITSIGILLLHLGMDVWQQGESWTFVAVVVVWVALWNTYAMYVSPRSSQVVEPFRYAPPPRRGPLPPPRPRSRSPPPPPPPPPPPLPQPPKEYTMLGVAAPIIAATAAAKVAAVDPSGGITKRPCQVYFTTPENEKACDDGLFFKDFQELKKLRDVQTKIYEDALRKKVDYLKELDEYESIVDAAIRTTSTASTAVWGNPTLSIQKYLQKQTDDAIQREESKASRRDTSIIAALTKKKQEAPALARRISNATYTYKIVYPRNTTISDQRQQKQALSTLRGIMKKDVEKLQTFLTQIQTQEKYKMYDRVIAERTEKGENMRCKNIYNGWDELASLSNPNLNDPIKSTVRTSAKALGEPSGWAYCYQQNISEEDWAKKQAAFAEKQSLYHQDVTYAAQPVAAGDGPGVGKNSYTGFLMFHRFNPGDMSECDDTLTTPDKPIIPNGLLEIKLHEREDTIQSMRRIKYSDDSRYIDPTLSEDIHKVDATTLRDIFYTDGYENNLVKPAGAPLGWQRSIKYYLEPNRNIRYDVYYLYYDTKCNRFIGNTDKTKYGINTNYLGPNPKVGDLIGMSSTTGSQRIYFPGVEITDPATIDKILQKASVFKNKSLLNTLTTDYKDVLQQIRTNIIRVEIPALQVRIQQQDTIRKQNEDALKPYEDANTCNANSTNKTRCANYRANIKTAETTITTTQKEIEKQAGIANTIQTFLNEITNRARTVGVGESLQSFIGRPVSSFVRSYNPSYLSNNRTFYLKITALTTTGTKRAFLHDPTTDAASIQLLEVKNPTLENILDDTTTYEAIFTFDDRDLDLFGIDPSIEDGSNTTSYQPTTITYVSETFTSSVSSKVSVELMDETYHILKSYTQSYFDDDLSIQNEVNNHVYGRVMYLQIYPGIQVTLINNKGFRITYRNSASATAPLLITLNSTMTGQRCSRGLTPSTCSSYMKQIQIRPN